MLRTIYNLLALYGSHLRTFGPQASGLRRFAPDDLPYHLIDL